MPLCKRQSSFTEQLSDVMGWKAATAARVQALGDRLEEQDGGPSCSELLVRRAAMKPSAAFHRRVPRL